MNVQQRNLVYRLKRQFGREVYLYDFLSKTTARQTGESYSGYNIHFIRKGIILSSKEARRFAYDLSFIAAAKNFTVGGFFDMSERLVIIARKDLPPTFELSISDRLTFDGRRYEVSNFEEFEQSYAIICVALKNVQEFDPMLQGFIDTGWVGSTKEKIALDELVRNIRTLFSNNIPSTFFLWPCCGENLTSAIKTLYHLDVTNTDFDTIDYYNKGVRGGLKGDAVTKFFNSNYPYSPLLNLANYHVSIMVDEIDVSTSEHLFGTNSTITLAVSGGNLIGALGSVAEKVNWQSSQVTGHFTLSSVANNSLKAYFNGVVEDENNTIRNTVLLTTINPYILANNTDLIATNFSQARIKTVTIGEGLTDAQVSDLYNAVNTFNQRLGRA